jgi:4-amino-4-deoxy-L-arabinose transferase-like glycosyltransferase
MLIARRPATRIIYFLLMLSLVGVLLVVICTSRYGAGVTPDSVAYISTARNLLSGEGYARHDGRPFVDWPPLFPTLLALIGLGGFDPADSVRYVNAISFGLTILVTGLWLLNNVRSPPLVLLGSVAILLSRPLIYVSAFAWTEPLFVLFVLLSVFVMQQFLRSGKPLSLLFLSAIFAALASLTRYIGVTVILTGLVALLLFNRNISTMTKLFRATLFAFISTLPLTAWVIRNYAVASTLAGERGLSPYTLMQELYFTLNTVSKWFLPPIILAILRILLIVLLFVLGIAIFPVLSRWNQDRWASINSLRIMPLVYFILLYTSGLIASATRIAFDPINHRLLAPIYVPFMLLVLFTIDNIAQSFSRMHFSKQALNAFLLIGFGLWLGYPFLYSGNLVINSIRNGAGGYSSKAWMNSELISYLRQHPLRGSVYSNAPHAIYILTGMSARPSPSKHSRDSSLISPADDFQQLKRSVTSGNDTYVVWFENEPLLSFYHIQELRSVFDLESVVKTSDGAIYLIQHEDSDRCVRNPSTYRWQVNPCASPG